MMWSEAILMVTKNVKFFKKCRQSEVKEFFKDLGKTGENRNRPVVREQGRVITFEDGKDLGCFELIWKNTLRKWEITDMGIIETASFWYRSSRNFLDPTDLRIFVDGWNPDIIFRNQFQPIRVVGALSDWFLVHLTWPSVRTQTIKTRCYAKRDPSA